LAVEWLYELGSLTYKIKQMDEERERERRGKDIHVFLNKKKVSEYLI
jgi:hypothetical protein